MYVLKVTPEFGRGLYATQPIKAGTILGLFELLVLDATDTVTVNVTALQFYTFKYNDKRDCIVLGDGEIFNHSDKPNVSYGLEKIHPHESRLGMQFVATRDIEIGEQLFIDYEADTKVNTKGYIKHESLMGLTVVKH